MRVTLLLGSLALPAALLLTGCTSDVPHVAVPAAPVTAAASTAPAPSAAAPSAPSSSASRSPAAAAPSSRSSRSTAPVPAGDSPPRGSLGPTGWGALRLGMTDRQASATGLIDAWRRTEEPGCAYTNLRAAPAEQGTVTQSPELGVVAIAAYGRVRTPQDIGLGSPRSAVLAAYPDWEVVGEEPGELDGRGYVVVPGNNRAVYRIMMRKSKVTELTLQLRNQNCYE